MNEARPGAVLAGRYRLTERVSVSPDESSWRAVDETLDRPVSVWTLRPGHPFAEDVLDGARRAALIEDRRLVTVLGVGTDTGAQGERAFVVSEAVEGRTLEQLTQRQPLSGAAARRITGEAAEGLAIASERGLHHLRLTPAHVIVTADGAVKIFGLAVLAAAAGMDPGHATRANRADARALVAVLYSALTGRWPLADTGFPPAERTAAGTPVPPRQVALDVPSDLNRLCAATFSGGGGPASPDQVALSLTPWSSAADAGLISTQRPVGRAVTVPALKPVIRTPRNGIARPGPRPGSIAPTARPASGPTTVSPPAPPAPERAAPPAEPRFRPAAPAPPPPVRPAAAAGLGPAPHPSGEIDLTVRAPSGRAEPVVVEQPPAHPPAPVESTGEQLMPWLRTWTADDQGEPSSLESAGPFPLVLPQRTPPPRQSRLVILTVVAVVAVVVALAVYSLRTFSLNPGGDQVTPTPPVVTPAASTRSSAGPPAEPSPSPRARAGSGGPAPRIAAIRAIDPQGDGDENTTDSPKAVDGDAGTVWKSQTYNSARFGGLKKGLGLAIRLERKATVTSVRVDATGTGGTVQLRLGPTSNPDDAVVVDSGSLGRGRVTLRPDRQTGSRYVILWFTQLPRTGDGYRAEVAEVRVT